MTILSVNAPYDSKERHILYDDAVEPSSVDRVMAAHINLTTNGFGFGGLVSPTEYCHRYSECRKRMMTQGAMAEFARAVVWLERFPRTKSINKRQSSYGLKHDAEKWVRAHYSGDGYVSNGMLIAAAIHLGFKFSMASRASDEPNVHINISSKPRREIASV